MKTLVCFCVMLFTLCYLSATAQTERGAFLVGGNFDLGLQTSQEGGFSVSFSPQVGYFVVNNFALGTSLPLGFNTWASGRNFNAGLSPFARYYFGESATRLFLEGRAGYNYYNSRFTIFTGETMRNSARFYNLNAGLGAVHFITQSVGLEAILGYNYTKDSNVVQGQSRIRLNVGLQIYLSRN
jgi:hypothetical protein